MRSVWRWREHLVEQGADSDGDIDVRALAVATDIVAVARFAADEDRVQSGGMILDMKPVTHIIALAVDRDRFAVQGLQDRVESVFP